LILLYAVRLAMQEKTQISASIFRQS